MKIILIFCLLVTGSCASKFKGKEAELTPIEELSSLPETVNPCPEKIVKLCPCPEELKKIKTTPYDQLKFCPCPSELKEVKKVTQLPGKSSAVITVPFQPASSAPVIKAAATPWAVGEKLTYKISAIGLDAAEFQIEVKPKKVFRGITTWHFYVTGKTTGFTTKIYYFNFKGESLLDEQLNPLNFQTSAYEGKDQKQIIEQYYPQQKKYSVYKKRNTNVEKNETKNFTFEPSYSDPISFFYFLRTVKNQESFFVMSNHKSKKISVKSIALENLTLNNKTFATEKLTLDYEGKEHLVWREQRGAKRVLKSQISMSFASGTVTLHNP